MRDWVALAGLAGIVLSLGSVAFSVAFMRRARRAYRAGRADAVASMHAPGCPCLWYPNGAACWCHREAPVSPGPAEVVFRPDMFAPDVFADQVGKSVPVTLGVGGRVVGAATMREDGRVDMVVDSDAVPGLLDDGLFGEAPE